MNLLVGQNHEVPPYTFYVIEGCVDAVSANACTNPLETGGGWLAGVYHNYKWVSRCIVVEGEMESWILKPEKAYQTKIYIWVIISAILMLAMCVPMGWAIGADVNGATGVLVGILIAIGANLLWILPLWIWVGPYRRSLQYEIEDDEVIVRGGVLTKTVKHVPYRTVTNIEITRGLIDRALGIGSLKIQTAGMSGSTGAEEHLAGVANVDEVYERVVTNLRKFRAAMAPDQASLMPAGNTAAPDTDRLLGEILDELKTIRAKLDK